ncbi:hypothetical protein [Marinicella rhabdoformis]|uniref:hypothetical protein n=1 Tax=Marinicella rhabdoformis TaxID=2580566 RepID=UPI0012AEB646|nr:hypothetical protein [Marinicella rhabdoformis]
MSVSVCAFIEYQHKGCWQLYKAIELADREPPYNFAPDSWGEYNFNIYYQQSGEKGLPKDLSIGLQQTIETQLDLYNDDALNRPSWMSLDELINFYQSDVDYQYAHFDLEYLQQLKDKLNADIRVVCWAE